MVLKTEDLGAVNSGLPTGFFQQIKNKVLSIGLFENAGFSPEAEKAQLCGCACVLYDFLLLFQDIKLEELKCMIEVAEKQGLTGFAS